MTEDNRFLDDDDEERDDLEKDSPDDEDEGFYDYDIKFLLYSAESGLVIATELNMPFVPDESFTIITKTASGKKLYLEVGRKIWNKDYPLEICFCCNVLCKLKAEHDGKLARFKYGQIPSWVLEDILLDKNWQKVLPEDVYIAEVVDAVDINAYDPNSPVTPSDPQFEPKDSDKDDKRTFIG